MNRRTLLLALLVCSSGLMLGNVAAGLAADPGNECWSTDYYPAGVSGNVMTMLSRPGAVYVGGAFSAITDVPTSNVARLDMSGGVITQVVPLGAGLDNQVKALCEHDGYIIAGGYFGNSGTTTLNRVARWDGLAWQPLGNGLPGVGVQAVASYQDQVYAGSYRFDGTDWENLFQTDGSITAMLVHDGLLYVGGSFTEAQGQAVANVFAWNGAQILALGAGFPKPVYAMTAGPAGVVFSGSEDFGWGQVSRWDGEAWTAELENTIVKDIAYLGDDLIVSANLYLGGNMFAQALRSNAGGTWHTIGDFYAGPMVEHEGRLLVKASAGAVPGILSPGLIGYDGANLQGVFPPANGFSTGFECLAGLGSGLVVGGNFVIADGEECDGSAVVSPGGWDRWGNCSDLVTSFPGSFTDLAAVGMEFFGVYSYVDYDVGIDILVKSVWDGQVQQWQELDPGTWFAGTLQTVGTELFNVGYGGVNQVDLEVGTTTPLPGLDLNGGVYGTCDYLGTMTICGSFTTNNDLPVSNVLRYVDGAWVNVGDPLPGLRVIAVAPLDGGQLAASTWVDGVWRVSVFDGVGWSTLPGDFDGTVSHLIFHGDRLFAAGSFDSVGPVWSPGISIWTGDQWAPVGTGLRGGSYGRVVDVVSAGDNLYLAGSFTWAGGNPSVGFAKWSGDPTLFTGALSGVPDQTPAAARLLEDAYPNPFNPRTSVNFFVPATGLVRIGIFDMRGHKVRDLVNESFTEGSYARIWNGLDDSGQTLPSGVYFARMLTGKHLESVKLTLVR